MGEENRVDRLWAPWRMEYIQDSEPEPGCLFCNLIRQNDDEANLIVHRGPLCFVMLNLYPYNSGHVMVVPYQHVGTLDGVEPEVGADMFRTAQQVVRVIDAVMHPNGYNMGINQGAAAGAGVPGHIHLHVVPRWGGDTNFMPVLGDVKVMPEMLTATAARLRERFARDEREG